ncbi:MAG: hypothetical protein AAFR22_25310, partial [Chloroflexota bacterium]
MARILIAEDERDIRELIEFTLKIMAGHEVIAAANGEEAVSLARSERPDHNLQGKFYQLANVAFVFSNQDTCH